MILADSTDLPVMIQIFHVTLAEGTRGRCSSISLETPFTPTLLSALSPLRHLSCLPSQLRPSAPSPSPPLLPTVSCVAAHYYLVFVHRQLSAKITMGLDTSFMVIFLICCIQGGACLLAWCLPLPPAVFAVSIVLFVIGLSIEAISDEQLHAFVSRKTTPGYSGPRVMTTGLRGFSRHPNLIGFVMYWCKWPHIWRVVLLPRRCPRVSPGVATPHM